MINSNSECKLIKNGFVMNPDAETIPCCTGEFKEFEFENWDEKRQSEIQLYDLSKNDWIDECNRCRVSEIATGTSARYVESQLLHSVEDDDYNIKTAIINGSNTCNLMCRMCGPAISTRWAQLVKSSSFNNYYHIDESDQKNRKVLVDGSHTLPYLKEHVLTNDLLRLILAGGEPLLIRWYEDIIDHMMINNYTENLDLAMTTNGTLRFNDKWQSIYKSLKTSSIGFSIDGVKDGFDYIRPGHRWSKLKDVVEHTHMIFKDHLQVNIQYAYVSQALNVHTYWSDKEYLVKWFKSFNRQHDCEWEDNINILFDAPYLSYSVISHDLRKKYKIEHISTDFEYSDDLFKKFMQQMAWQDVAHTTSLFDHNPDFFDTAYYAEELINEYYLVINKEGVIND